MNKFFIWILAVIGVLVGLFLNPIMEKTTPSHEVVTTESTPVGHTDVPAIISANPEVTESTNNDQPSVVFKSHYGIDIPKETKNEILAKYDELKEDFPFGDYWIEVTYPTNDDALDINVIDLNTFTPEALQASESKFYYDLDSLNEDDAHGNFSNENEEEIRNILNDISTNLPFDFVTCRELKCMFILNKTDTTEVDILGMHSRFKSIRGSNNNCYSTQSVNDGNKLMMSVTCKN